MKQLKIGNYSVGGEQLTLIAGPCALESLELGLEIGEYVKNLTKPTEHQFSVRVVLA